MGNVVVHDMNLSDQDSLDAFVDWFLDIALMSYESTEANKKSDCIPVRFTVEFMDEPFEYSESDDDNENSL